MRKVLLSFLFVYVVGIYKGSAQGIKSFPSDSIQFFNQMETFLTDARKEGKDFMKQFEEVWYGGYFSEAQRRGVYNITNQMLNKKMRAFPDFRNYLYTVGSFVTSEFQTESSFDQWQATLLKLLDDRNKRNFANYLTFSDGLFSENALYVSSSTKWAANNNNYIFGFEELPILKFESLDLVCFARGDSLTIKGTKGIYYPTEDKWVGEGGTVTWDKAGMMGDEVYATLSNYEINTKTYSYTADSVNFFNSFYFDRPLLGSLEDKILANNTPEKSTYPRFDSYNKRLVIQNIAPAVDYDGGFSMQGSKFIGSGNEENDAYLIFYRNDTTFLRASSKVFIINPERIVSDNSAISFYLGKDSIHHPGLNFKFFIADKEVTLYRDNEGIAISPYFDSFHNIDMDCEVLNWNQEDPIIEMTSLMGSTRTEATFTSENFFKLSEYEYLRGRGDLNPLLAIQRLSDKVNDKDLTIQELTYHMNISDAAAESMVMYLATRGFLKYNFKKEEFTVKNKLTQYVQASFGKIDYDVISIKSDVKGKNNAQVNLLNYDLTINGVEGILLSDSQKVVIIPSDQKVVMKKNRFFTFQGQIKAVDVFDFYGKEFSFDYEAFKINLTNVDSLQLKAYSDEVDRNGNPVLKPVRTVIEGINGELLIDNFANKSGLKEFPEFPVINSFDDSYVFYDKKEVQGGVYNRNDFYFQVKPFQIDSLDNFSNDQLVFDGSFTSNIFPTFDEELSVQPDMSLGFVRKTPPGGYPTYGGKGQFYNDIKLSHSGLRGDGKLEYLTSTTLSDDFIFYPKSVEGFAQSHVLAEVKTGTEFPPVEGVNILIDWKPFDDVFYTTSNNDSSLAFYDMKSFFRGTSALTPLGLKGNGIFLFERANLISNQFVFQNTVFDSDTADFELLEENTSGFALNTANVKAHVDFKGRFAEFVPNGKDDPIFFPTNQYLCYMEEFKWYMDNGMIDLTGKKQNTVSADVKLEGSKFISTKAEQDSLFFYSPIARFDSRKHLITAMDVQYIATGDAKVFPDSGLVVIRKSANMDELLNSGVLANAVTEYHNIYNANIKIEGKKSYFGSGYIDYVDESKQSQSIYLQTLNVDTTGQTVGHGVIEDSTEFSLSAQHLFKGEVDLLANNQFLIFDGGVRISHACAQIGIDWLRFRSEINPNEIYIPIDTGIVSTAKTILSSSINLNTDTMFIYSAFVSQKIFHSDRELLPAYGFMYFDKEKNTYKISNKEKINSINLPGNYLELDANTCKVSGEGLVNLSSDLGQVKMITAGRLIHNQPNREDINEVIGDFMMTLDFHFDDNAMKKAADQVNENLTLQPVDLSREVFEKGLKEIMELDQADKLISQLNLNGKYKRIPDELDKTIVFNDIKFKWDEEENTFTSFGPIGVSNFFKEQVNKYMNGVVQLTKRRGGDILDVYLETDANNWYYFNYRRGLMQVASTNEGFNEQIKSLKDDKRKADVARKEEPFSFMYGNPKKKEIFLKKFEEE